MPNGSASIFSRLNLTCLWEHSIINHYERKRDQKSGYFHVYVSQTQADSSATMEGEETVMLVL